MSSFLGPVHTLRMTYDTKHPRPRKRHVLTKHTLTDKERAAAAREHWELHHTTWSPKILGHYNTQSSQTDRTILMTPTKADRMFEYFNNPSEYHENLRNLP